MTKFCEIIAPAHWASFLINGDGSSLSAAELNECKEFCADNYVLVCNCLSCQPVGIMRFNGVLTDCEEYVFRT